MASKRSHPGTDNPEKEPPEKLFLMKLADCCNLHAESSHASSKPMRALTEQDEMPERCQRDIVSLSKILPRVEETYAIDKEPHVSFLPHLCSFYESVIHGVFCPHAPLLLEWGKGGKQGLYSKENVVTWEMKLTFSFHSPSLAENSVLVSTSRK